MGDQDNMIKLKEFDLSLCDEDIASAYKEYSVLNYQAERPLLCQLSRDIRGLVDSLKRLNLKIKVSSTEDSEQKGSSRNDAC